MRIVGVLGLSSQKMDNYTSLLENIKQSKQVSTKLSLYLPKLSPDQPQPGDPAYWNISIGELIVGGSDESKYIRPIKFTSLPSNDWTFTVNNTKMAELSICKNCSITIDSAVDMINFPEEKYFAIIGAIGAFIMPGSGNVFIPCFKRPLLPDLVFQVDHNLTLTFSPYDYIYKASGQPFCFPLFGVSKSDQSIVFGRSFLAKYMVEFDYENQQIGFAQIKY